jgi:hypothetical protein
MKHEITKNEFGMLDYAHLFLDLSKPVHIKCMGERVWFEWGE